MGNRKRAKRTALLEKSGAHCFYCSCPVFLRERHEPTGWRPQPDDMTLDHLKPKSNGGADDLENLVIACRGCNEEKADRAWPGWQPGSAPKNRGRKRRRGQHYVPIPQSVWDSVLMLSNGTFAKVNSGRPRMIRTE